jgi:hypothetical protein
LGRCPIFIRLSGFHKWYLIITCSNSLNFGLKILIPLEQLAIFLAKLASWIEMNFCQFFTWRLAKCSNENALIYWPSYITVACKFVISISNARVWKPYEDKIWRCPTKHINSKEWFVKGKEKENWRQASVAFDNLIIRI